MLKHLVSRVAQTAALGLSRRVMLASVMGLLSMNVAGSAWAADDNFPSRPVQLIVPYAAGGTTDTIARILAEGMSEALGQRVLVENVTGAGALNGTAQLVKAEPDGYTLMTQGTAGHVGLMVIGKDVPFEPVKPFAVASLYGYNPLYLLVNASSAGDITGFIKQLKEPGGHSFGSAGVGSTAHVAGAGFASAIGVPVTHIPYKSNGAAALDLLAGRIEYLFDAIPVHVDNVRNGKLRALAVAARGRSILFPDVPTMTEAGFPQLESTATTGMILAPAGTTDAVLAKINDAVRKVVANPNYAEKLAGVGVSPMDLPDASHLKNFLQEQYDLLAPQFKSVVGQQ